MFSCMHGSSLSLVSMTSEVDNNETRAQFKNNDNIKEAKLIKINSCQFLSFKVLDYASQPCPQAIAAVRARKCSCLCYPRLPSMSTQQNQLCLPIYLPFTLTTVPTNIHNDVLERVQMKQYNSYISHMC